MAANRPRYSAWLLLALAVGAACFLMFGPPGLLAKSERPNFCASCHVMESEYEAWFHAGAHRRKDCVDCHLPHQNAGLHYIWKSIDGLKDVVVFYSGQVPEHITISEHGQRAVQANCLRCHQEMVSRIGQDRKCWDCHRRITHLKSASLKTE